MDAGNQIYVCVKRQKSVYYLEASTENDTVLSLKNKLVHILQKTKEPKDIRLSLPTDFFNKTKAAAKTDAGADDAHGSGAGNVPTLAASAKARAAEAESGAATGRSEIPPALGKYVSLEDKTVLEELNLEDGTELAMSFWVPGNLPSDGRWEPVQIDPFPPLGEAVSEKDVEMDPAPTVDTSEPSIKVAQKGKAKA